MNVPMDLAIFMEILQPFQSFMQNHRQKLFFETFAEAFFL